ncbi:glycosyl hydrolase family 25 [Bifidobacterium pullorum subsp. saeculare]|uniref:GH25 family lysozyme n=1 Tax=Bifidobacterium pullorum TaxID=78448 RepID=UPI00195A2A41|nr:GH25 family lysozyme [Bifidobacterium pullorum]MBM6695865.1 glycosyl hydrolase family 25 [Bifidobacterium pullorum subsp. saeculare]
MPSKGMVRAGAVVASLAVCAVMVVPAQALTDSAVDTFGRNASFGTIFVDQLAADTDAMPNNPTVELPDEVSEDLPNDALVVSPDLVVSDKGEVKSLETGETVTAEELVGTPDTQPDPLAKTNGESFIPVEVGEVKEAVRDAGQSSGEVEKTGGETATVRPAALGGNEYGAYWGTFNNTSAFFEADGTLFVQQAKGVIDVSEWQGQIDWEATKNAGVEGAIIRISYGWNNGFDKYALHNISECKRLGIPFGIYSYSYAYDSASAAAEGADIVNLMRQAGVQPGDLSYPVFYDLERWTWTGHTPPTSPSVYDGIVNAWYAKLQSAGYTNLSVYSYYGYLDTALNSSNIHSKTRWLASYGPCAGLNTKEGYKRFNFPSNNRGWQYTSGGTVAGIAGRVDLNAFGNATAVNGGSSGNDVVDNGTDDDADDIVCSEQSVYRVYNKNSGLHHYTKSRAEVNNLVSLGWRDEGVSFCAVENGTSAYRLYNPNDGNHMYTLDGNERRSLVRSGWKDEGVGWDLPVNGDRAVYRLYNPNSGEHVFTTSYAEYQRVGEAGWKQEGIAWYSD